MTILRTFTIMPASKDDSAKFYSESLEDAFQQAKKKWPNSPAWVCTEVWAGKSKLTDLI